MLKTIGSDMELFARDRQGNHIALCGKIGGTKEQPLQVDGLRNGFMVQEDNVAFEFNIPPCNTERAFIDAIKTMRLHAENVLKDMDLFVSDKASIHFDVTQLTHPKALIFGCEADYNAYTREENPKPTPEDSPTLRTCGGHVHVGTDVDAALCIQNMDLVLGVPSVILDGGKEAMERRQRYGKAGALRPKGYGVEYRTLSNFWMFTDELVSWVYKQTERACQPKQMVKNADVNDVQTCINTGDKTLATRLIEQYSIAMPA